MYHQRLHVSKADDRRFHQRQVVGHVIEEIVKPIANIKQSQSDIPQQQYEGHSLIFQDKYQADRQSKDIEERRDAYQEEILNVCVNGKLASEIYHNVKKIYPLKRESEVLFDDRSSIYYFIAK